MQLRRCSWWANALACLGLVLPTSPAAAQTPATASKAAPVTLPAIADVALRETGGLSGVVLNVNGLPMARTEVSVLQAGQVVTRTTTDTLGQFNTDRLRGGVYQVAAGHSVTTLRVWELQAAPPSARRGAMIVGSAQVVRGQRPFDSPIRAEVYILGAVVAAAIAIPIIITNSDNDSGS